MDRPINPYVAGLPIQGEKGFFGRQDILRTVQKELSNPGTNVLLLFGQRRIGKTTLLKQLHRLLPSDKFLPVFFDLMDRAGRTLGEVLTELAEAILDTLAEKLPNLAKSNIKWPEMDETDNTGHAFEHFFMETLLKTIGSRRPIILLDEFDVLDTNMDGLPREMATKSLFEFLRKLMSKHNQLAFVFAMGRNPEDLSQQNYAATFKSSITIPIGVLEPKDARSLVLQAQEDGTLQITESALNRILDLTGCHPYFTQLLCQRIWERAYPYDIPEDAPVPVIEVLDVDSAVEDTLQSGGMAIRWLWDGLSPAEKVYASALVQTSEGRGPIQDDKVKDILSAYAARLSTHQVVVLAPRDLVKRGILVKVDDSASQYNFSSELLYRWIRNERPLDAVKDELDKLDNYAYHQVEIGKALLRSSKVADAIKAFEEALSRDPGHLGAHLNLGETYMEVGDFARATQILENAYSLAPQDALSLYVHSLTLFAQDLFNQGEFGNAARECEKALNLLPRYQSAQELLPQIWHAIGTKALADRQWAQAIDAFEKAQNESELKLARKLLSDSEKEVYFVSSIAINQSSLCRCMAFSPDGLFLATGGNNFDIVLWGANTGKLMRAMPGHVDKVNCLSFMPKSSIMASSSADGKIILWDVFIGKPIQNITFGDITNPVSGLVFSPDGQIIASILDPQSVILWNVKKNEMSNLLEGHSDRIAEISFSPDGKYLASASYDKNVILWNAVTGDQVRTLIGHDAEVTSISFSYDGNFLASASNDSRVMLWDASNGEQLRTLQENAPISRIAFSPKGPFLAAAGTNGKIHVWNILSDAIVAELECKVENIHSLIFSADGNLMAVSGENSIIQTWRATV